ncbi:cob(I)yrinic acid a,c-diamide adenosyltransferase [Sphingomonas rhizophila]|uniref:Corrinoid adenosyltransferase n=1 Tax=Sphingomonas rhizophila TaxID=2071607 RepID=A0A7G9SAA9_9SPHN|nr:cob(I)yrinic acid a,c-diamide adenosyltransferase [Sphingomonas rhizophila]QNN64784.1 cob(I)yrinic acid a,c-diamide adenosyltransferase [Sphingomonas rhizophila]
MVKLNKIYTRTGDGGTAGLVDGSRVSKSSARLAAIGDVDEANSAIGLIIADVKEAHLKSELLLVQNELFDLGADLATPFDTEFEEHALRIIAAQVERIEHRIDHANADLEPLTSFILPSGSRLVASLHLARAVTRRAERSAVALRDGGEAVNPHALAYLNRLSDYLFVLARFVAAGEGGDVLWQPGATRGD